MSLKYLLKAFVKYVQLEMKFNKNKPLSKKMGVMCDLHEVPGLPHHKMPIRVPDTSLDIEHHKGLKILVQSNEADPLDVMPKGINIIEYGNEIENGSVTPNPLNPAAYCLRLASYRGARPFANPGLVSINQEEDFWKAIFIKDQIEEYIDYIAIHLYIPSRKLERIENTWPEKKWYRKLSDKWEFIKAIAVLMEFRDITHKPILVTEIGVCQLTAEVPEDVEWADLILNDVLGERLVAATWYNYSELCNYPGKAILAYCNE